MTSYGASFKHTTYHTNGSGRDMYIFSNNGGYTTRKLVSKFDPSIIYFLV